MPKVFDMGKCLSAGGMQATDAVVSFGVWAQIRKLAPKSHGTDLWPYGIQIECIDDWVERRHRAFLLALTHGRPVLFEGENGQWLEASMPKPDSLS